MAHAFDYGTREAEAGISGFRASLVYSVSSGTAEVYREMLSQKKKILLLLMIIIMIIRVIISYY